jgi:hypothetical protein
VPSQGAYRLGVVFDVLAVVEGRPKLFMKRPFVSVVKVANNGLNGFGCFFGIVKRDTAVLTLVYMTPILRDNSRKTKDNLREQMMNDMGANNSVENVTVNPSKVAVDSGKSAFNICPALLIVVIDIRVVVV